MNATYLYCVVQAASAPRLGRGSRGLPHTGRPRLLALDPGVWLVVADAPGELVGESLLYALRGIDRGALELAIDMGRDWRF